LELFLKQAGKPLMKIILLILAATLSLVGYSQDRADTTEASVIVRKDPRLDIMVKKQAAANAAIKKSNTRSGKGFRLLVINTNKRDEAIDAKTKIYTYYPELKSYLTYQSPFFKVKAGNFRTREEAEKYRKNVSILFPKGVFIIQETIEIKPEKDKEEE
jgi:hypothetical protein